MMPLKIQQNRNTVAQNFTYIISGKVFIRMYACAEKPTLITPSSLSERSSLQHCNCKQILKNAINQHKNQSYTAFQKTFMSTIFLLPGKIK